MKDLWFSKSHEWVRVEDDVAVIGITDYAQSQLGDVVFVELPQVGDQLAQAGQLGTIESTKTASEIYAPVSGQIVAINAELVNNPQWVNEAPYDKGWMVKIKLASRDELQGLMSADAYKTFVAQEAH